MVFKSVFDQEGTEEFMQGRMTSCLAVSRFTLGAIYGLGQR